MRDHRKLRAFELADELAMAVLRHTLSFPRDERFGLTMQLRRCALSVPSNIVEGCARDSRAEYIRFLDIAHGSAHELEYQLTVARRLGYLNDSDAQDLEKQAVETCKVLNGLLRALRSEEG